MLILKNTNIQNRQIRHYNLNNTRSSGYISVRHGTVCWKLFCE